MIRIEGIPVVAARLAGLKSTRVTEMARPADPRRISLLAALSRTVLPRRSQKNTPAAA
jgi:hypothetical protein